MPRVSALTAASTPLGGTEVVYVVQGGNSRKTTVADVRGPDASKVVLQTAVTAAAQTSIDFTGIPAWVNRVNVMFTGFSTTGTSNIIIQIGDSGGIEATGYDSTLVVTSAAVLAHGSGTTGFLVTSPTAGSDLTVGIAVLSRVTGNTWAMSATIKRNSTAMAMAAGDKTLSATLTQLRITTVGGTETFDAGSVAISWE